MHTHESVIYYVNYRNPFPFSLPLKYCKKEIEKIAFYYKCPLNFTFT